MFRYRNVDGDSGVVGYEIGSDFIRVKFPGGTIYSYTSASAGAENIERMKQLACSGDGLNAFINMHVRKRFARKER